MSAETAGDEFTKETPAKLYDHSIYAGRPQGTRLKCFPERLFLTELFLYNYISPWTAPSFFATVAPLPSHRRRGPAMARTLTKSHEHFRRALKRLPLGVTSNF